MKHSAPVNNLSRFALACVLLTTLASAVLYAQFEAGYYSPVVGQQIDQRMSSALMAGANYPTGAYALFNVMLEPGDGREEVQAYCNTCHSPSYITMQPPLPADTWSVEVKKMIATHGASIPDDSLQKIVQYLQTHYTPETRKR